MYTLTIGDRAYSSWSMRGWLLLAAFDLAFEEEAVPMYSDAFDRMAAARAPARSVPQIAWSEDGREARVWDTLAIAETLAERHPDAGLWPAGEAARRIARVAAAQMHAGYAVLRGACPMNLHREARPLATPPEGLGPDVARLDELWAWCLAESGGPWLAGRAFSAADVFAAPYATRLAAYALDAPASGDYAARVLAHGPVARWIEAGRADPRRVARYEVD
ncbi:MAG: glutathione S-transferase N-terminal domain-containing protein [Paracoccaceae bacterium]